MPRFDAVAGRPSKREAMALPEVCPVEAVAGLERVRVLLKTNWPLACVPGLFSFQRVTRQSSPPRKLWLPWVLVKLVISDQMSLTLWRGRLPMKGALSVV